MTTPKRSKFRDTALVSGLVTEAELQSAFESLREATAHIPAPLVEATDDQLATQLVEVNVLTQYQADQLKAGRTKLNLGPYTITDWIGQGGMGQVFKAVHKVMGREVAIKVLPRARRTPESISNFIREIRVQARLDHPNLVRAYDAGHDGNVHYLVTEFVAGTDLRRLVRAEGKLDMQRAANVILNAAKGLTYAHNKGLIHRDIKPGNLLVTPDGDTKVSDLGLAGFVDEGDADPRAGKIVGTADYIAPELFISPRDASPASDIYSLGCTLYYAVTGKVPFPGGTTRDKQRRHRQETPWHPRRFNPEVTEEFVEVIADMMEKNPADRINSTEEVGSRLERWASDNGPQPQDSLIRSPWTMPPPDNPVGREEEEALEETETDPGSESPVPLYRVDKAHEHVVQATQVTDAMSGALEDTETMPESAQPLPVPPPPPVSSPVFPPPQSHNDEQPPGMSLNIKLLIVVAIAIPLSMIVGSFFTILLWRLFY